MGREFEPLRAHHKSKDVALLYLGNFLVADLCLIDPWGSWNIYLTGLLLPGPTVPLDAPDAEPPFPYKISGLLAFTKRRTSPVMV